MVFFRAIVVVVGMVFAAAAFPVLLFLIVAM